MDSLFCQFIVNYPIPVFEEFSVRSLSLPVLLRPVFAKYVLRVFEVWDGAEPDLRLLLLWQLRYEVPAAHGRDLLCVFRHILLSRRGVALPAVLLSPEEPVF